MPLSHEDVTATVSVTGLALGCYNPTTQNYEVGLMRVSCHILRIEVIKQLEDGSTSRLKFEIDEKHRIFIDTENGILPENPIYTDGETFDRNDASHDNEDFRWVVDFEKELNSDTEVALKSPADKDGNAIPVTEMYVEKPLLYADPELFVLDNFLLVDKTSNDENPFGLFTEGIKADLKCQKGGAVVLRIDGPQGFEVHLPHLCGQTHLIKVDNTCPEDKEKNGPAGSTDFNLYYSIIEETNGTTFDVKPENPPEGEAGEGAVCNGSFLGVRGSLFPIP